MTRRDGPPALEGYAAVFHVRGDEGTEFWLAPDVVERVAPGAFDEALAGGGDVAACYNHDVNQLLGRTGSGTLTLSTDRVGLRYEIDTPDTRLGRDLPELIGRGDLSGSSFAFLPTDVRWADGPDGIAIRDVLSVELLDVGPVTYPAYAATTARLGMRSRRRSARRPAERPYSYDLGRTPEAASVGRKLSRAFELDLALFACRASSLEAREFAASRMPCGEMRREALRGVDRAWSRMTRSVEVIRRVRERQLALAK